MDKSKAEEETYKIVVTPENWSDWWHEVELICQRPIRELIVQLRGKGMFLNSFWLKQKLCNNVEYLVSPCGNYFF
jgi:hypothetical protein